VVAACAAILVAVAVPWLVLGQTTQGIISGRVFDSSSGMALKGVSITCTKSGTESPISARSTERGSYSVPGLSPGVYSVRFEVGKYQPAETGSLWLSVAGHVTLDVPMRPASDIFADKLYTDSVVPNGGVVEFFTEDLQTRHPTILQVLSGQAGTLQSTLSYTVDRDQLDSLPLASRDTYSLLVTLPGVTNDVASGRGLGLSINGQRVSSSNFLLDGIENNNYLLSGPLTALPPEETGEYRVSTNNYSAEYGRTAGFVANAVTRSGTDEHHGLLYGYLGNELLNANSFAHNGQAVDGQFATRAPEREFYAGYSIAGPLVRGRLHYASAAEAFRNHTRSDSQTFAVPVAASFQGTVAPDAARLLKLFPPPAPNVSSNWCYSGPLTGCYEVRVPVAINRISALERLDWNSKNTFHRLMGRVSVSRIQEPDFIFNIYPGLTSELDSNATSLAGSYIWAREQKTNELRLGFQSEGLNWNRPYSAIPTLYGSDGTTLPGSQASYEFRQGGKNGEIADSFSWIRGRSIWTAGGGLLLLRSNSLLSYGRDGFYQFGSADAFFKDTPLAAVGSVSLEADPNIRYDRTYANNQFYGFIQSSVKWNSRFTLDFGLRYESFGALKNTGVQDGVLTWQAGETSPSVQFHNNVERAPYQPDRNNFAGRFGLAYGIPHTKGTVFRAAYGIFYDRPFDNLTENTRNNNYQLFARSLPNHFDYLAAPVSQVLASGLASNLNVSQVYWIDPKLRTPYVQSWFAGVQQAASSQLYFEVSHAGALGRKLITTDVLNREGEWANVPEVLYRSNEGSSNYFALSALAKYHTSHLQLQASYTWSRSIDNQSEPLLGDFFDLSYIEPSQQSGRSNISTFTQQGNSSGDRGNSDFDQRQNLVFFSIWELPGPSGRLWMRRLFSNWRTSEITALRSGLPFTVYAGGADGVLIGNRANLVSAQPYLTARTSAQLGEQVLNPLAFTKPANGAGNLGRNSLTAPGFWNTDFSLSRTLVLPRHDGTRRIQLRADLFNLFNHVNLGSPLNYLTDKQFGISTFGLTGLNSAFPATVPISESPRQIRLQLKLYF
jgi:hypothetical protein